MGGYTQNTYPQLLPLPSTFYMGEGEISISPLLPFELSSPALHEGVWPSSRALLEGKRPKVALEDKKEERVNSPHDLALTPIGIIHSPFKGPKEAPQQGRGRGEIGEIEVFEGFEEGLRDIEDCTHLILIFWMDRARRDLLLARPPHEGKIHGVFATRSPHRPNPLGLTVVELLQKKGRRLWVKGIDAVDGTPLLDIKPYFPSLDAVPGARIKGREGDGKGMGDP